MHQESSSSWCSSSSSNAPIWRPIRQSCTFHQAATWRTARGSTPTHVAPASLPPLESNHMQKCQKPPDGRAKEEGGKGRREQRRTRTGVRFFVCGLLLYAMCPCAQWHGGQTHRSLCACPAPVISLIALFMKHSHWAATGGSAHLNWLSFNNFVVVFCILHATRSFCHVLCVCVLLVLN